MQTDPTQLARKKVVFQAAASSVPPHLVFAQPLLVRIALSAQLPAHFCFSSLPLDSA